MKLSIPILLVIALISTATSLFSQGFQPTIYGTIQVRHFGYTYCNKPFDVEIYTNGDLPINGQFTVTFNTQEFELTSTGNFQLQGNNTLTVSVDQPTHATTSSIFSGKLKPGVSATNFTIVFEGVIGFNQTPTTLTNTLATPVFVTANGNLSAMTAPGGPLLPPGTNGSTAAPQYVILGTLNSDLSNYTFAPGSELLMIKEDASITIPNECALSLFQTEVYGCTQIWDKILVKTGGKLKLKGSFAGETVIENAQNAVVLENGSYLDCFWSTFKGNKTGILVPANGGSLQTIGMDIVRTTFTGGGPLLDGSQPLRAMLLNDLNTINLPFLFGGPFALGNSITGFTNGIEANNARVNMQGVSFSNIAENGIRATNNSKIEYNGLGFSFCFNQMPTGIWSTDGDLNVERAEFNNVSTGIRADASLGDITSIKQNKINSSTYGIRIFGGGNSTGEIFKNTIKVSNSWASLLKGYGIGLFDLGANVSTNDWNIFENDIQVSAKSAIYAVDFDNAKIRANTNIKNTAANKSAIYIGGGIQNEIECNPSITSAGDGVILEEALYFDHSCNSVEASGVALQIFGECLESKNRGNTLNGDTRDLAYGSEVFNFANTEKQPYAGNRFMGGAAIQAKHFSPNPDVTINSQYKVRTQNSSNFCTATSDMLPTFESASNQWFLDLYEAFLCNFKCNDNCVLVPGTIGGEGSETTRDQLVRDGIWGGTTPPSGMKWNAERYLYRKMANSPTTPTGYQTFLQTKANTSVGQTVAFDNQLQTVLTVSNINQQNLSQLRADREVLQSSLSSQNYWIWQSGNLVFDANAYQTASDLLSQIRVKDTEIATLVSMIEQPIQSNLNNLAALNNIISGNATHESAQRTVNAFHLNILANGMDYQPSGTELAQVKAIAQQCPMVAGTAVYQARAIVATYLDELIDNPDLCTNLGLRSVNVPETEPSWVSIQPNPANDLAIIRWVGPSPQSIWIFDALGRIQTQLTLPNDSNNHLNMDTSNWASGLYFVTIQHATGKAETFKLTIQH